VRVCVCVCVCVVCVIRTDQTEVLCNFEDDLCTLTNVTVEKDQWMLAAALDQIINKDNTLSLGKTLSYA